MLINEQTYIKFVPYMEYWVKNEDWKKADDDESRKRFNIALNTAFDDLYYLDEEYMSRLLDEIYEKNNVVIAERERIEQKIIDSFGAIMMFQMKTK